MSALSIILALLGSAFAGILNTLAGNGSAITLTLLTELFGLPGNIANGTNRVGIFGQTSFASYIFNKHKKLPFSKASVLILLCIVGALLGVYTAISISNEMFMGVVKYLMIFILLLVLIKPKRWLKPEIGKKIPTAILFPIYVLLGFYGGFIQMGMGVFFLATVVLLAKYDLIQANALKNIVVLIYTAFVLAIFHFQGLVDWKIGLIFALGQSIGGIIGAKIGSKNEKATLWAYRLLIVSLILAIFKLFDVF